MRKTVVKRMVTAVVAVVLIAALAVGGNAFGVLEGLIGERAVAQEEAQLRVAFCVDSPRGDAISIVRPAEDFTASLGRYTAYRSDLHHDALTQEEQRLYHVLEYAMESGYTTVLVDRRLVQDGAQLEQVLLALALDSALLEESLVCFTGENRSTYTVYPCPTVKSTAALEGWYITVPNFGAQWWKARVSAMEKVEDYWQERRDELEQSGTELTQMQMALEAYEELRCHMTLRSYTLADRLVYGYLSDAMKKGISCADGYANALSLYLHAAGIPCMQKAVLDEKGVAQQVWVCAQLDGVWVNLDVTDPTTPPVCGDESMAVQPLWAERYPVCISP